MNHALQVRILDARFGSAWPLPVYATEHSAGLDLRAALPTTMQSVPCIVVTADHGAAVRDAVRSAGCHLLHKPLRPLALRSLMGRLVS